MSPIGRARALALVIPVLVLGALAVFLMTRWVLTDWVYDEGTLPPEGGPSFVIGAGAWFAAVVLLIARRGGRAVTALAAAPVLLAVVWLAFWT